MWKDLISWKEFIKHPLTAILFATIFAIGYLYIDNRNTLNGVVTDQRMMIDDLHKQNFEIIKQCKYQLEELNNEIEKIELKNYE